MPPFSRGEIERRWEAVRGNLGPVDALVACSFHGAYYLSGIPVMPLGRWAVVVLPRAGEPAFVVPRIERGSAIAETPIDDVRDYDDGRPTLAAVADLVAAALRERGVRTAGIEDAMPVALRDALAQRLPGVTLSDATEALDAARLVSSGEEIALVRRAAVAAAAGLAAIGAALREHRTEHDVAARLRAAMAAAVGDAGDPSELLCIVQGSARSGSEPHRPSTGAALPRDGFVQVLCEAGLRHYRAAAARAVAVGRPTAAERRALDGMEAAFAAALGTLRAGNPLGAADVAARTALHAAGAVEIPTGAGFVYPLVHEHGGRSERGELRAHNERPLHAGMVVMLEPWAPIPGVGGPRRADMVLVTPAGPELLTAAGAAGSVRPG